VLRKSGDDYDESTRRRSDAWLCYCGVAFKEA
jgi:hypothetical protein